MNLKRIIAREWLYLLGFVAGSVVLVIAVENYIGYRYVAFWPLSLGDWTVVLPYAVFLFIRTIIWSVRQLRA